MRSIAEYTTRILEHKLTPSGHVARSTHERAARRAATRSDATVAGVITEVAADARFLELPVGRVDPESWAAREELARLATDRLEARGWSLDRQQRPPCVHHTFTSNHLPIASTFVADLGASLLLLLVVLFGRQGLYGLLMSGAGKARKAKAPRPAKAIKPQEVHP